MRWMGGSRSGASLVWLSWGLAGVLVASCESERIDPEAAAGGASTGRHTSSGTDAGGASSTASGGGTKPTGEQTGQAGDDGRTGQAGDVSGGQAGDHGVGGIGPTPELDGLLVAGVAVNLKPAFDPKTTRYSLLAAEPERELVVAAAAASGLDIEIDGRPVDSGATVALPDVRPGSEFVVDVRNAAGDSKQYRVSYLPAKFPNYRVVTREDAASEDPLYLTARNRDSYYVVKLNNDGVPLFYRETDEPSFDFKKQSTGHVSYAVFKPGTTLTEHVVLDDTFTEVDRVTTVGLVDTDEHEFVIQPNGNYIVLAYERVVRDLTEFGRGSAETILDGIWQELSPDREVLFQWNSWDHMVFGETVYGSKDKRDYSHMNSVFVDDDGNWIVSSRGMAQILKIDRGSGDVIWKLGGAQNDFTFVNDPYAGLCGQHTASILENGHLLIFDNGQYCYPDMPERGNLTRIVEYAIDEDEMTAELVWSYSRDNTYTGSQGSAQRLPNGNTLIGWGLGTDVMVTEVTPDKEIVFELQASSAAGKTTSYRAWRFAD